MASVSKHLGLEPSEQSFRSCSLSDSDPQTDTGNNSDNLIGRRLPTGIVIGIEPGDEIKKEVREEDGRRPIEENYPSPLSETCRKMMPFHMTTGDAR